MAKRIAFSVLCTLLVLVVILTGIVIRRVNRIIHLSAPPEPTTAETPTAPPITTDPMQPTQATQPPHEHDFVLTNTIPATCEGYGWNIYNCSSCGYVSMPVEQRLEPLGHDFGEGQVVPATCTEEGYTVRVCRRCNRTVTEDPTPALGHSFTRQEEVAPTCEEDGYTRICCSHEGCQEVQQIFPNPGTATGHTYGAWTYGEDGQAVALCCVCHKEWSGTNTQLPPGVYTIAKHRRMLITRPSGQSFCLYEITVSIHDDPASKVFHYSIYDYLDNGTLVFYYEHQRGLVIVYRQEDGSQVQIVLDPESEQNAIIQTP